MEILFNCIVIPSISFLYLSISILFQYCLPVSQRWKKLSQFSGRSFISWKCQFEKVTFEKPCCVSMETACSFKKNSGFNLKCKKHRTIHSKWRRGMEEMLIWRHKLFSANLKLYTKVIFVVCIQFTNSGSRFDFVSSPGTL